MGLRIAPSHWAATDANISHSNIQAAELTVDRDSPLMHVFTSVHVSSVFPGGVSFYSYRQCVTLVSSIFHLVFLCLHIMCVIFILHITAVNFSEDEPHFLYPLGLDEP